MNYAYLNRYFSRKSLLEAIFEEQFDAKHFTDEIVQNYAILQKEYRNEFFYKNTLFNNVVLGKFSLNTTSAFNETIIEKSKADFLIINHHRGMVYEIKTDLDNLDRLMFQLEDYYRVFSEVYVVTSEKNYYPVYKYVKEHKPSVGIIVLNQKVNLSLRRHAIYDESNLKHENLFKLLRKKEFEEILIKIYGELPNVKQVEYYRTCLEWFKQIDIIHAQKLTFFALNKRNYSEIIGRIIKLPMQIRWLVYSGNYTTRELEYIYKRFNI